MSSSTRFSKATGKIRVTKKQNTDRIEPMSIAYLACLHLLARAKHLHTGAMRESDQGNTYAAFVVARAYFETCMALGFLSINIQKKYQSKDLEGIWNMSYRILQGVKSPSDDFTEEEKENAAKPYHIYDYFDEVDEHYQKVGGDKTRKPHRETYDNFLSEFGHPNFAGLITASYNGTDEFGKDFQEVDLDKMGGPHDKEGLENYLGWGYDVFGFFWNKLIPIFTKEGLSLPSLS